MIIFYFSGTGNSKYIAELFCQHMNAKCYSIEEHLNVKALTAAEDTIAFCYPIYCSRPPRNIREFVIKHRKLLKNKKLIILCTQMLFSGDGARAFMDFLPHKFAKVIYAEHFFMPNNITNVFILPNFLIHDKLVWKLTIEAQRKMQRVCRDIKNGVIVKRGFNPFSKALGFLQAVILPFFERLSHEPNAVKIKSNCTGCGLCVSLCPMDNLAIENHVIVHKQNCVVCYRCVNQCPKKAITAVFHGRVKKQYKGLPPSKAAASLQTVSSR